MVVAASTTIIDIIKVFRSCASFATIKTKWMSQQINRSDDNCRKRRKETAMGDFDRTGAI